MINKKYLKFSKEEFMSFIFFSLSLSLLFSTTKYFFSSNNISYFDNFLIFFIFISSFLFLKFTFLKLAGYYNAVKIDFSPTSIDNYGLENWQRRSYLSEKKPIPFYLISIVIYIFSFGLIIYSNLWKYTFDRIPHMHLLREKKTSNITNEIYCMVLFYGNLFILFLSIIVKILFSNSNYYFWFQFVIFYIVFMSLIPIFGSEGYELFRRKRKYWRLSILNLISGFILIMVFTSISTNLILVILSIWSIFFYLLTTGKLK